MMLKRSGNPPDTSGGEKVNDGQVQDFGRVFGSRVMGVLILVLLMAFSAGSLHAAAWAHKKQITINAAKVPSTQTDFPVLISITDTDLAADAQDNGDDICFTTNADETNPDNRLSHEIEYFDGGTGQLVAWVKIPSLSGSSDTNIYMHYGNASATNQQNPTDVWDSNYKMVQHLEETSGTHYDSTTNDNDGSPQNGLIQDATGKINGADEFDGSNDYINVPHNITLNTPNSLTYEAWTYSHSWGNWHQILRKGGVKMESNVDGRLGFELNYGNGGWEAWSAIGVWTVNQWHYYVVRYDGSYMKIFLDDVEVASKAISGSHPTYGDPLTISVGDASAAFDGIIDEVRVSDLARSDDWITTCYNNQSDQTVGLEYFIKAVGPETDSSLPVELSVFTAQYLNNIPTLYWQTQSETNNAGWNIYRGETNEALSNEEAYLLNLSLGLIPGAGTTSEPTDYSFEDFFPVYAGNTYFYWLESVDYSGESEIYGPISLTIPENEWQNPNSPEIPKPYGLHQNYPNPFNPNTEISLMMKESCIGELSIYNIKGQKIIILFSDESIPRDELLIYNWDGKDESEKEVSSGIYLYELKTNKKIYLKRMLLIK